MERKLQKYEGWMGMIAKYTNYNLQKRMWKNFVYKAVCLKQLKYK